MRCVLGGFGQGACGRSHQTLRLLRHPHQLRRNFSQSAVRSNDVRGLAASAGDQSGQRISNERRFAPGMKQRRWGRIVNMASSTLGSVVSGFVHYMASKAGIVGITRALASELAPFGITVDAISPGLTRSPGTLARVPRAGMASMEDEYTHAASMQAIKRPETPADLVGTVSFLTSDDAAFMTGQTGNVDGGRVR